MEFLNISNKYLAYGVNYATKERFRIFKDNRGDDVYVFIKTKKVEEVHNMLKKMRFNE